MTTTEGGTRRRWFPALPVLGLTVLGLPVLGLTVLGLGAAPRIATAQVPGTPTAPPASAGPPLPGIMGADDRQPFEPTDWPFTAIGRVNREVGGFCTGTLIGPRLVLTAAHCLLNPRTRIPVPPHTLHFVAGYVRGEFTRHARASTYVIGEGYRPGPGASLEAAARDWAVVVLETPVDLKPVPVRALSPAAVEAAFGKKTLTRAGYSQDRAHLPTRTGDCGIVGLGTGSADLWLHDCDATRGDSGSAMMAGEGEDVSIVGLQVANVGYGGRSYNLAISASTFADAARRLLEDPGLGE